MSTLPRKRNTNDRNTRACIFLLAASLLLASCARSTTETLESRPLDPVPSLSNSTRTGAALSGPRDPIKIGVAFPLTGAWSVAGTAAQAGMLIARDEINAAGGIKVIEDGKELRRPLELIIEDTHSSVPDSVTAVKKLIEVDNVPALIAGGLSAEAVAIAPVAQQARVVLLSPLALTTPLKTAGEWVFKLRESTSAHATKTLEEISKRGYKKIGILAQSYEACDDFLARMKPMYNRFGLTVAVEERYQAKDDDVRTQLGKLKQADPDALFQCGLYQDTGLVFKQAKELGFSKPSFAIVAIESPKLFEIAGDAAEGTIYTSTLWSCEHAPNFCAEMDKTYKMAPDYRSAFAYDSVKLIALAIERSSEGARSAGATVTPEGIKQGLLSIKDFVGAGGSTSFDADGNAQKEVIVKQVTGRSFVVI